MWTRNAATVVLSIVLSILATLIVDRHIKREASNTVRAQKIELVDDQGNLRGAFRMRGTAPELVLFDDHGDYSAALYLDDKSDAGLSFALPVVSRGLPQGHLTLGRLTLDDTSPHAPSMMGWGLWVDSHTNSVLLGISDTGKGWNFPASPTGPSTAK